MITNDRTSETVTSAEFAELEWLFSCRLASKRDTEKTILLQAFDNIWALALVSAAWRCGWKVAVVRTDANKDHLEYVRSKLDSCLHIFSREGTHIPVVRTCETEVPLDIWLDGEKADKVTPYEWRDDECAVLLFTSGTTGMPKGVCHSHGNLARSAKLFIEHFGIEKNDRLLCLAPAHTMSGLRSLVLPLYSAARVCMLERNDLPFLSIVERVTELKPTKILCGPIFIKQVAAYGKRIAEEMSGVDSFLCTGAELDEDDRAEVETTLGIPVLNFYGLTETSGIVLAETPSNRALYCLPPLCKGVQISLISTGPTNKKFRLKIKSKNIFLGYLGEPLSRKRSFDTGDIVEERPKGLKLIGRSSSAIKAPNTEWVYPGLLESWLKRQAGITGASVKGTRIAGGYGLKVSIDCLRPIDTAQMAGTIERGFGPEYKPVEIHYTVIEAALKKRHDKISLRLK